VAPGLKTTLKATCEEEGEVKILIWAYRANQEKEYLIERIHDEDESSVFEWVPSGRIQPSRIAPLYPVLEVLMERANDTVSHAQKFLQGGTESLWQRIQDDDQVSGLLQQARERLDALRDQLGNQELSAETLTTLSRTGIQILQNEAPVVWKESQAKATQALDHLLKDQERPIQEWQTVLESLSQAAKQDRDLQDLVSELTTQTSAWQGSVLQTRSASLFAEGASRLHSRARALFQQHVETTGSSLHNVQRAFTAADVAVTRVKSMELGQALTTRLVSAIQAQDVASHGLDGILESVLKPEQVEEFRERATSVTTQAHETLLSVLSSQSSHREAALLKLEDSLHLLHDQLGMDIQELVTRAREGGTKELFEPLAAKALQQVDEQLAVVEKEHKLPSQAMEVLQRVRKVLAGDKSVQSIMNEVTGVLNDDKVVSTGETIVQHSEKVLDAIEGVSGNKAVEDAIRVAEKAGITKDSVMKEIGKLDVNKLIDEAGSAVTDEEARQRLLSSATDTALDFALRVIPSMPVPPLEGVNDGLVYEISNLSMEGFRVRKEDIRIQLAGMSATKGSTGSPLHRDEDDLYGDASNSSWSTIDDNVSKIRATELLIIDIRNISAVLDSAEWSFEQTYMPYLKGNGLASTKMSGGQIRLQFELRKRLRRKEDAGEGMWEPVLCLHDRSCSISDVDLSLNGEGSLTWILNKLAGIFRTPLRDYVVRTILRVLTTKSGWILHRLNGLLSPYWDLIMRTAKLKMVG